MMHKILFVTAADSTSEFENRYRPLWPGYLAAFAEKQLGLGALDFRYMAGNLESELAEYRPDIVAIGSVSQNFGYAIEYARIAKEHGKNVLVGGAHITLLPRSLTTHMDVGVIGEGEQTFSELMELYLDQGGFPADRLAKIKGIVYREDGQLVTTPPRPLIEKLDDIPHPKRSLIGYRHDSYIMSSRGCPYNCSFCASTKFWNSYRNASAEYLVEEIEDLAAHGCTVIRVNDDLFASHKKRLQKVADLMVAQGLREKVGFGCLARANHVTKELVQLLKEMKVVSASMGLESGSERTLAYLKGKNVTVEDNERAVHLFKEAGIQTNGYFIIGAPDETEEEIMDTYRFIKRSPLDFIEILVLVPLPGTIIWQWALDRGLVSEDMDWNLLNINFEYNHEKSIIVSERLTREEIHRLYKKFRRLRFYRIARSLPTSPWLGQVPRVVASKIVARASRAKARLLAAVGS
ncbi:MAG: radical SAM protein [Desulfomonile tiedjei]|nr:radical SAM protein [Desulfomonile tiedjei]